VDEDARLAAELHAQLNGGRATRTSKPKAAPRKRSSGKKKSKDTVDSDISDDERNGGAEPAKKKRKANPNNAFMKPLILSAPLAAFIGEPQMSRPEVVKKIWAYVKLNDLQDPTDRRYIICDDSLKPVFGEKVHML
jgi:upstream activation factor subunit UAF30